MSNIFSRIKNSVLADLHQAIDEKEQKNPVATLNQFLRQAEQETEKVKKTLERQYRLKDEFTKEYDEAKFLAKKRLEQAKIAEAANEMDLYEFAMREYEEYNERANRMEETRDNIINQIDEMERKYAEMNHKLKEMYLKRMELMGRENVAKANYQMNKVFQNSTEQSFNRFYELERYIERIEQQVNQAYYESTFDEKIARLKRKLDQEATEK